VSDALTLTIVFESDGDWIVASIPEVPGAPELRGAPVVAVAAPEPELDQAQAL
jgi:hypothetical protein